MFLPLILLSGLVVGDEISDALKRLKPLAVRSLTPQNDNPSVPFSLYGRAAITIVFNRAVIALGSDWGSGEPKTMPFKFVGLPAGVTIPGKTRWVTTSIARFDPDVDWPTDLDFDVVVQPLVTFDGSQLSAPYKASYTTMSQSFYLSDVSSKKAVELTNGAWSSNYGYNWGQTARSNWQEVPSDGVIRVSFGAEIEPALVGPLLKLTNAQSGAVVPITTRACAAGGTQCLEVVPSAELARNQQHILTLPAGSRYRSIAGPLRKAITIENLSGLFPFEIPFTQTQATYGNVASRIWRMYLRHGLASDATCNESGCPAIASLISLSQNGVPLQFTLTRPQKAVLELRANVDQQKAYELKVAASSTVLDGFQQPLLAGAVTEYTAAGASLLTTFGESIVEKDFDKDWAFVHRQQGNKIQPSPQQGYCSQTTTRVDAVNVTPTNVMSVLTALVGSSMPAGAVSQPFADSTDGVAKTTLLQTAPLWGKSQTFLMKQFGYNYQCTIGPVATQLVSRADIGVVAISGAPLVVLVTKPSDNSRIANAKITLYQEIQGGIVLLGSMTTNQDGIAQYTDTFDQYRNGFIVVESEDQILIRGSLQLTAPLPYRKDSARIVATTDRNLYKEGDTVSVKGYLRQFDSKLALQAAKAGKVTASVQWASADPKSLETVNADVNEFGAFTFDLHVPNTVDYNVHSASIQSSDAGAYGSVSINIADPRIPTGVLTIKSKDVVYRPAVAGKSAVGIKLDVSTTTYTGAPLASSEVTIDWQVNDGGVSVPWGDVFYAGLQAFWRYIPTPWPPVPAKPAPKGTKVVTTGADGLLSELFVISDADLKGFELKEGQSLSFSARMIGPTREQLTSSLSMPIRASPWQLRVKPTTAAVIPGIDFGSFVDVQDEKGNSLYGKSVTIALVELASTETLDTLVDATTGKLRSLKNQPLAPCTATSDGGAQFQCVSKLPKAAKYLLKASVTDDNGNVLETVLPLGRTAAEWQQFPLNYVPRPELVADKKVYNNGESIKLTFLNSFANAILFVRWGNQLSNKYASFAIASTGRQTITLSPAIGEECRGGCNINAALVYGRDNTRTLAAAIPVSAAFDLGAPRTMTMSTSVDVNDDSLALGDVTISTDKKDDTTTPRESVEITVAVNGADGKPLANGEVHLFVVDRKLLDLSPLPVLDAADGYKTDGALDASFHVDYTTPATVKKYQANLDAVQRRAALHPWTSPRFGADVDLSDEEFLSRYRSQITYFGGSFPCEYCWNVYQPDYDDDNSVPIYSRNGGLEFGGGFAGGLPAPSTMLSAAAPMLGDKAADSNSAGAAAAGTNAPETRTKPVYTVLSATARVVNGVAKFKIEKMVDNLGIFRMAALATDGIGFAHGEKELHSVKKFNVEPSLPRIARVDDRFKAGVSISSNLPASMYPITLLAAVNVQCEYIGLLDDAMTQKVVLTAAGAQRVEWGFEAVGVTPADVDAKLWFTLLSDDAKTMYDRLEATFPVLQQQPAVSVATSFAVEPTADGKAWPEGMDIPEHVANSAEISVEAGVGRLPSIRFFADRLLSNIEQTAYEPSGAEYVGALHATPLLSKYTATLDTAFSTRLNNAFARAVSSLTHLTLNSNIGLVYYYPIYQAPTRPDISLNLYALWVYSQLTPTDQAKFAALADQWKSAVSYGFDQMAIDARKYPPPGQFMAFDLLAEAFFTLGFDYKVGGQYPDDFTVARLFANVDKLSTAGQATLAAALYLQDSTLPVKRTTELMSLLNGLMNKYRVQGRTAYLTYSAGSQSVDTTASYVGLIAFAKSTDDKATRVADPDQLIEKLANYVAAPRTVDNNWWYYPSPRIQSVGAFALVTYDVSRGNDMPNFTLRVKAGEKDLLEDNDASVIGVQFSKPDQAPAKAQVNANELTPLSEIEKKDPLTVYAKGSSGEASVVIGIDFIPCERQRDVVLGRLLKGPQCTVSKEPVYRGISVEKIIRQYNPSTGETDPKPILSAKSGTQVEVTIQLTTPDDLDNVMVVDYLAAGLEAFEFAAPEVRYQPYVFFGRGGFAPAYSPFVDFFGWWWWSSFPTKEVRKDRVTAFAYRLPAGTASFTYKALVVTPGEFALPPTKAYAQGQPELLGLSAGGKWGSQDPAWQSVTVGRTARVCQNDAILLLDGSEYVPAGVITTKATATQTPTRTAAGSSSGSALQVALSTLAVLLVALLL